MKRLVLLAALLATPVLAQRAAAPRGPSPPPEAAERYHEAARLYVDGQNAPALAAAEAAVALAPDDARAVALRDLIKKKQDQQNQNQQNQDGEPPPDDPNDGPPPPDDGGEDDPSEKPGQDGQQPPPGGQEPGPQNPGGPSEMSREQAERILDAVGGDERLLLRQMRRPPSRVRTNEEDW